MDHAHNLIRNIMPDVGNQLYFPLALTTNEPLQVSVGRAGFTVHPAILQLGEVAFKEANLVLISRTRLVCRAALDGEMVVKSSGSNSGFGLRNQLRPPPANFISTLILKGCLVC
jgi:hypothetical protein